MITADLGHGRGWLRADAAASILRIDRQIGHPLSLNDAGRTNAEQWEMWRKYGSPRAAYPGTSTHETGIAIDTDERLALLAENGWTRPFNNPARKPYEPWHYKYVPANDRHRNDPAPAGHTIPTTQEDEEDDMASLKGATYVRAADKANVCILFNEASGFYVEHTGVGGNYNNPIAENWGTGTWPPITESHATVIKRALDAVRRTTVAGSLSVDLDEQ